MNGTVIAEFVGITGSSQTLIPNFTLNDGDFIRLTMFQAGGGFRLLLQQDADRIVGDPASGIAIYQVPEPASISLLAIGALAILRRRRVR